MVLLLTFGQLQFNPFLLAYLVFGHSSNSFLVLVVLNILTSVFRLHIFKTSNPSNGSEAPELSGPGLVGLWSSTDALCSSFPLMPQTVCIINSFVSECLLGTIAPFTLSSPRGCWELLSSSSSPMFPLKL